MKEKAALATGAVIFVIGTILIIKGNVYTPTQPTPPWNASSTNDTWQTVTVQKWAWAYQTEIPKGWSFVDEQKGGTEVGIQSLSQASSDEAGVSPEILLDVSINDGGKTYAAATGTPITVGGSEGKLVAQDENTLEALVFHANSTYKITLLSMSSRPTFDHLLSTFKFLPFAPSDTYTNKEYGFSLVFPTNWRGFTVTTDTVNMYSIATGKIIDHGIIFEFNNPSSTQEDPYEKLPIMVFTPKQWQQISDEANATAYVSAAPFPPAEIASNTKYVFALPPRYNYDFSKGWGEVDAIAHTIQGF